MQRHQQRGERREADPPDQRLPRVRVAIAEVARRPVERQRRGLPRFAGTRQPLEGPARDESIALLPAAGIQPERPGHRVLPGVQVMDEADGRGVMRVFRANCPLDGFQRRADRPVVHLDPHHFLQRQQVGLRLLQDRQQRSHLALVAAGAAANIVCH